MFTGAGTVTPTHLQEWRRKKGPYKYRSRAQPGPPPPGPVAASGRQGWAPSSTPAGRSRGTRRGNKRAEVNANAFTTVVPRATPASAVGGGRGVFLLWAVPSAPSLPPSLAARSLRARLCRRVRPEARGRGFGERAVVHTRRLHGWAGGRPGHAPPPPVPPRRSGKRRSARAEWTTPPPSRVDAPRAPRDRGLVPRRRAPRPRRRQPRRAW